MPKDVDPRYTTLLPTPYVVIQVGWGEKDKHLYNEGDVSFHETEEKAREKANTLAKNNPDEYFVICSITGICQGKVRVSHALTASPTPARAPLAM